VFLVQAEHDEVCPLKQALRFYGRLPEPKEIVVIDAADHLFDGKASEVGDAVEDLVEGLGRTGASHVRS
jgi:alpha/beta superfamily hydrolase